jgi:hypothetical protein
MFSDTRGINNFHEVLEVLGEEEVRKWIAQHGFPEDELRDAEEWLAEKARKRQAGMQHRQELRADKANRIARKANLIALAVLAFSFVAIIVSVVALK